MRPIACHVRCKLLIAVLLMQAFVADIHAQLNLIPAPVKAESLTGEYQLPKRTGVFLPEQASSLSGEIQRLGILLLDRAGIALQQTNTVSDAAIVLQLTKESIPAEGYRLQVQPQGIRITATTNAGLFYGLQTLRQLLPPAIEGPHGVALQGPLSLPCVSIEDYPRFGWRGLMLDVVRHWFTKEQVKQFIDRMVQYKYNRLHLHLSDDQGWRVEIKSLPKLTEIGAWRAPRQGRWGEWSKPSADEPKTYGGYYTHEDIRELVAYAAERFVTILPEIDVPGHSMAMVAAYPELSCTPGTYQVNAGDRFMIWEGNGSFYGTIDNNLCPANEVTYQMLDKVFTEIADLFPYEYIHMGGDECYKGFWEKSDAIKQLMKREGLKNMEEVQSYFVKRVGKIIASKGKKMMGWDEIMEGGLAEGAAVMSWRGEKGGIEAAHLGHPVVMSPNSYAYVDLYQGDPVAEPPTYSMLRLSQSYRFDPLPKGIDPNLVLGGQANLWSERLNHQRHAEYMLWPRGWAIAESVWSPQSTKNWDDFVRRTEHHFQRFDAAGINYSRSMYDPIFSIAKGDDGAPRISLATEVNGLKIHYAFDESFPDAFYPVYEKPLHIPKDASNLRVITSRDGKLVGKMITMPVAEINKRMK